MPLVTKTPPQVGDAQLNRVIQQIYRDLNEIIATLSQTTSSLPNATEATDGSIRITQQTGVIPVKDASGVESKQSKTSYIVSIKTKDGWINSAQDVFTPQSKTDQ